MFNTVATDVGERMQYVAHKFNDTTMRFLLSYPGFLKADVLSAATKAVIDYVDVLHASFVAKKSFPHWKINAQYETEDYFSFEKVCRDPMERAKEIAVQPVEHEGKCQIHVALVEGDRDCIVVVRISHLISDGSDGVYLLNKLAESYRLIEQTGSAEGLDVKHGNRSATCVYRELGMKEWLSLMKTPFSGVKTDYPFERPEEHGECCMLHTTISEPVLDAARKKAKEEGASVNDLLMTACCRSYARATKRQGIMSLSSMIDLRRHCKNGISEGLSNMSGALSTVLEVVEESSFTEDLRVIARQTKEEKDKPLAGLEGIPLIHLATKLLPLCVLLPAADIVYRNLSLSFTNLGNIPCEPLTMEGMKPTAGIFGGPLKRKPSVQMCAASFDGVAQLTILGDFLPEDICSLQAFLNGMQTELEGYIKEEHEVPVIIEP